MNQTTYLSLPPLPEEYNYRSAPKASNNIKQIEYRISEVDRLYRSNYECFGNELKLSFLFDSSTLNHVDREQFIALVRRLFLRTSFEPIVMSYWDHLCRSDLTFSAILPMVRALAMSPSVSIHGRRMSTLPDGSGRKVVFAAPSDTPSLDQILVAIDVGFPTAVERAIAAYYAFVICHPFTDGNGRAARALLLSRLAAAGLIASPCLPLGPLFYKNVAAIIEATTRLSENGDWSAAISATVPILEQSIDAAAALAPSAASGTLGTPNHHSTSED